MIKRTKPISKIVGMAHHSTEKRLIAVLALLTSVSVAAIAQPAMAQTWDGEVSDDWTLPENWSGNALPTGADSVFINATASVRQPVLAGTSTVATMNNLSVGQANTGTLVVRDGAVLNVGRTFFGFSLAVGGIADNAGSSIFASGFGNGTLTITGAGSRVNANNLVMGQGVRSGGGGGPVGLLEVLNGGVLNLAAGMAIGSSAGSRGTLRVVGPGSALEVGGFALVNIAGSRVEILDGASVSPIGGTNWEVSAANGLLISGANTAADLGGTLRIFSGDASFANAAVIVENGAIMRNGRVSAAGSTNRGPDSGAIIVRSGGRIITGSIDLGFTTSRGAVLVDGGSLEVTGEVLVGSGSGVANSQVVVRGGGSISAARVSIAAANNEIVLGGLEADGASAVGTYDVANLGIATGGRVLFNHNGGPLSINSAISGGGQIQHIAGTTIFTGTNSGFTGITDLSGGILRVNGTLGSGQHRLQVANGAQLGGSGTVNGTVSITNGRLAPGNSAGNLTINGNLELGAASILDFELGRPDGTAGVDSDLVTVLGNLTLDGTLNVADAGGFGGGLYRLINYGGNLTDNGLELGSLPTGVVSTNLQVQTSVANQVNLIVAAPAPTSFPFWDGSSTVGDGQIAGGSGIWNAAATNWTTTNAATNGAYNPNDLLIFTAPMAGQQEQPVLRTTLAVPQITAATPSATAGTVSVDDSQGAVRLANGLQFAANGYTITGDGLVLDATVPCGECAPLPGKVIMRVGDGTNGGAGFTATIQSALTGAAGLEKTDRGTLILAGANTYSGGTTVTTGMVQGNALSLQGEIAIGAEGILLFLQDDQATYASTLSGTGTLAKQGAGALTVTGNSAAFTGTSVVTGGELAVDGTLGSGAHVLNLGGGSTLSGGGRIGGSVLVADGVISPGGVPLAGPELIAASANSGSQQALAVSTTAVASGEDPVGLLTIDGNFSLTSASILAFQLGDPTGAAGVASDMINVGGNLTLDGTLNVRDAGGFGAGLYRLINYGGTLTDNGLGIGVTPQGFTANDLTIQTSVARQVNLLVATPVTNFNFWDGANTASNGTADGGTATWRADTTNWTVASGNRNGVFDPSQLLIFAGTAGTVTVDNSGGQVGTTSGLQFATSGYRVEGGAVALNGTVATMRVGDGSGAGAGFTATIASVLTGAAQLEKTDLGTLILAGANTYAGGTRVLGGVLEIADDSALGATTGAVALDGGTLRSTAALSSARGLNIGSGGGTIDSRANTLTLSGSIAGTGDLNLMGSGTRTLSGNSGAFAGASSLAAGTLALSGSLGGRLTVAAPATLTGAGRVGGLDLAGTFSPGAAAGNTATFNVTGDLTIRSGAILRVDVAASGAADRIEVGGRALLEGGTVAVTALDPDLNYTNGSVYRIVNATGGLSGTFAGLTEASAFLDFRLGYDPTGAFLTTTVIAQFPEVAQTLNQIQASGALMELGRLSATDSLVAYNAILLLGADQARDAFDATSGEIYPTLLAGRQRAGMALAGRIAMRGRAGGRDGLAMWGGVLADRGHVDGDGNGARNTAENFGWEAGVDYRGHENQWALGFGGGWQEGNVALRARISRAQTDAWHLGGYARYGSGAAGFSVVASMAYADAEAAVTRQVGFGTIFRTALSNVDLRTTAASGEMRYGFGNGQLAFGPLIGLEHATTKLGRVAETGAGALNLSSAGKRESWTRFGVGGFARYGLGSGFADLSLRYVNRDHDNAGLDLTMEGSPTGFAVRTAAGSSGAVRVDANTEFFIGSQWAISGNLGATHADTEGQIDGSVRLSYRF